MPSTRFEEYTEEHAVEDGLLAAAIEGDKISKALVGIRLKEAKEEGPDEDEVNALKHLLKLYDAESAARRAVKDAQEELDLVTLKKYGNLTEQDIKALVLHDKWSNTISTRIASTVDQLTAVLVNRIQELGIRYSDTVASQMAELNRHDAKVVGHLAAMGIKL